MIRGLLAGIFLIFNAVIVNAQDTIRVENPVENQFNNLIQNSNDYQGFKVVDYNELVKLRNSTLQFIAGINDQIVTQQNTIDQQQDQINQLREDLEMAQLNLQESMAEKDSISFLGMPVDKSTYMSIVWGIIAVLVLTLIFFILRYKKSHQHTAEAREKLAVTEKEFDAYRAKALEKEQRLGRLLQDERNKTHEK